MTDENTPVLIRFPASLLAKIDDYRFSSRAPSRAEAIRRLVEAALADAATLQVAADDR